MSAPKTGGQAFPIPGFSHYKGGARVSGMSLRDYFACRAMAELVGVLDDAANLATLAYGVADAMLAERERGGE